MCCSAATGTSGKVTPGLRYLIAQNRALSQISIWGAKSENQASAIQWLADYKTLEKANLRQSLLLTSAGVGSVFGQQEHGITWRA
jgi:hypothetical protein